MIAMLLNLIQLLILIRVILSWIQPDPSHPAVSMIYRLTEPMLAPIRRMLPANQTGIDFSPLILLLIIYALQRFLLSPGL